MIFLVKSFAFIGTEVVELVYSKPWALLYAKNAQFEICAASPIFMQAGPTLNMLCSLNEICFLAMHCCR